MKDGAHKTNKYANLFHVWVVLLIVLKLPFSEAGWFMLEQSFPVSVKFWRSSLQIEDKMKVVSMLIKCWYNLMYCWDGGNTYMYVQYIHIDVYLSLSSLWI